jgi:CRISPR-associated protein Cas1
MFTHKDITYRTIFVINCIKERNLRVSNGELLLQEKNDDNATKTLTKIPFQKILALFVIGHITVTTPLIEKCHKFNVALVVVKPNLRPVFYWSDSAEANYLLRQQQYAMKETDISVAKVIVHNKIENQLALLAKTRKKDAATQIAMAECTKALPCVDHTQDLEPLLGLEGNVAKQFFGAYYQEYEWKKRLPRAKCDIINTTLDIGYTILFNFMECFARMFGFDIYIGVYHRLWFKRKSLICDLMEPFRCIIDHAVLLGLNRNQIHERDFLLTKGEYHLKYERTADYYKMFFDALIERKADFFSYVQAYYRCFMGRKSVKSYPKFHF